MCSCIGICCDDFIPTSHVLYQTAIRAKLKLYTRSRIIQSYLSDMLSKVHVRGKQCFYAKRSLYTFYHAASLLSHCSSSCPKSKEWKLEIRQMMLTQLTSCTGDEVIMKYLESHLNGKNEKKRLLHSLSTPTNIYYSILMEPAGLQEHDKYLIGSRFKERFPSYCNYYDSHRHVRNDWKEYPYLRRCKVSGRGETLFKHTNHPKSRHPYRQWSRYFECNWSSSHSSLVIAYSTSPSSDPGIGSSNSTYKVRTCCIPQAFMVALDASFIAIVCPITSSKPSSSNPYLNNSRAISLAYPRLQKRGKIRYPISAFCA